MKNRVRINVFIIITAIIFAAILVISNVWVASVGVATTQGSYAESYAKKHHLKQVSLSDNQKKYFDERYESFEYNFEKNGIVLEKYAGVSETLVVPLSVDGNVVIGIGENFFKDLNSSVKSVYLPETITEIKADSTGNVTIYCTDEEHFKSLLGKDAKIETYNESEFVNYFLDTMDFDYNINGSEVEITHYNGNVTDIVVIPSYINGMPVRTLSLDMLGKAGTFVIPDTVTSITGMTKKVVFGIQLAVQLCFTILAFLFSLIMVNIILPRFRKNNSEYLLSSSQIIVTILYVIAQVAFCIVTIYFVRIPPLLSIVVSAVILVAYIACVLLGGAGREHAKEVSQKIEEDTSFMRNLKESTKNLADGIEDEEAKKAVEKLVEEIRFSKLKGGDDALDNRIGNSLDELKNKISSNDFAGIKEDVSIITSLLKKR